MAIFMALLWTAYNAYYFWPDRFDWKVSLPLQVCDLLGPAAAIAIRFKFRIVRAFLYFCAFPLATQAVLTPTGNQDPRFPRFWLYWTLHAFILSLSAFDLIVLKYRPLLKDFLSIVLIDSLYVAMIAPVDAYFGWNYGYLGDSLPDGMTAISYLGSWPSRILFMFAIVIASQSLLLAPWLIIPRVSVPLASSKK
jgi:hypothetical integral membrane protein (TIGR02206 family)